MSLLSNFDTTDDGNYDDNDDDNNDDNDFIWNTFFFSFLFLLNF